jgi:hypothetical protein
VPRAANALTTRIGKIVQRGIRRRDELSNVQLGEAARDVLVKPTRWPGNQTPLGAPAERVRLEQDDVEAFLAATGVREIVVEGVTAPALRPLRGICGRSKLIAALPAVFFEPDIAAMRALLVECKRAGVAVEVNSWGGWWLAKQAGVRMESGPGLPVLNSLAARVLAKAGIESVTLSPEADRRQLEDVTAHCPVPCTVIVFGRPPLMISRAQPPPDYLGKTLIDRRETRVLARLERGLWVLRPTDPFDLRNQRNDHIRVKRLAVDLVGSPDPIREWAHGPARGKSPFTFNYERGLG